MSCVLSEVPAISLPVCTAWPVISGVEIFTVGRLVGGGSGGGGPRGLNKPATGSIP